MGKRTVGRASNRHILSGWILWGCCSLTLVSCREGYLGPDAQADAAPPVQADRGGDPGMDRSRLTGSATVLLQVRTAAAGVVPITLELNGAAAPITAGHFVRLAQEGFWDGLSFYQVEKDPEPFVVRAGDPRNRRNRRPRPIPLEIKVTGEATPRYNTPLDVTQLASPLVLPHREGAVGMARSSSPESATSEFYLTLSNLPILDGRYAVLGYVTEGMEWVHQIQVGDVIESATVIQGSEYLIQP